MSAQRRLVRAVLFGVGLPVAVAVAQHLLRPEFATPLLVDEFGRRVVVLEGLLCVGATALYAIAALVPFTRQWPRVVIVLAGVVFFTLPALLGAAFGPFFVSAVREG